MGATTGSPGPARTTTCGSGSPGSAPPAGLDLTTDRMGNQWAWWGDPDAAVAAGDPGRRHRLAPGLGARTAAPSTARSGSSGALAAVDRLREDGFHPERARWASSTSPTRRAPGSASPAPAHGSSPARSAPTGPAGSADLDGVTMAEAMRRAGHDPTAPRPRRRDAGPDRHLRRAARRAGPRPRRPRPPRRCRQRHLAARALAGRHPRRGQPRRHDRRSTTARTPCSGWPR